MKRQLATYPLGSSGKHYFEFLKDIDLGFTKKVNLEQVIKSFLKYQEDTNKEMDSLKETIENRDKIIDGLLERIEKLERLNDSNIYSELSTEIKMED